MAIKFVDNAPIATEVHYSQKTLQHEGKVYKLGWVKGKELKQSSRASSIIKALCATIFTACFGLLSSKVRKWWSEGVNGFQKERIAVLQPDAEIAQKTDAKGSKILASPRPEKSAFSLTDLHMFKPPTSLKKREFPEELGKLMPKAIYCAAFTPSVRFEDSDFEKLLDEKKIEAEARGVPLVVIMLRWGDRARNLGAQNKLKVGQEEYPVLNVRFDNTDYIVDERAKQEIAEFARILPALT